MGMSMRVKCAAEQRVIDRLTRDAHRRALLALLHQRLVGMEGRR
jgi:hypothetical protein